MVKDLAKTREELQKKVKKSVELDLQKNTMIAQNQHVEN